MYIFIDIGGTNTRIGVSSDLTSLNDHLIFETPENYPEGIDILNKKISEIKNGDNPFSTNKSLNICILF